MKHILAGLYLTGGVVGFIAFLLGGAWACLELYAAVYKHWGTRGVAITEGVFVLALLVVLFSVFSWVME